MGTAVNTLLALIEAVMDRTVQRRSLPARPFDMQMNVLDVTLARTCLGWQPILSLPEGLSRTWLVYLAHDALEAFGYT